QAKMADLKGPIKAQQFLYRGVDLVWLGAQQRQLLWVGEQRVQRVGEQVGGGVVAGDQEQSGHGGQFVVGELVLVLAYCQQRAEQVVGGGGALAVEQLAQVVH